MSSPVPRLSRSTSTGKTYEAQVVSYDPRHDIAILDVPNLPAQPLTFAEYTAEAASTHWCLGSRRRIRFAAMRSQIREVTELNGPDIYHADR